MNVHPHGGSHPHWRRNRCSLFGGAIGSAAILASVLLPLWLPARLFAATNVFSPTVSYSYTDGGGVSTVVSYQYLEWPGNDVLGLLGSRTVSYGFGESINVIATNRVPTTAETTPTIAPPPVYSTQLVTFVNGSFTTNAPSPSKMTIVLTHGWNDSPNGWATNMAQLITDDMVSPPNIVAWDWTAAAASPLWDPGTPADNAGPQGRALGAALQAALGSNYSQPIHFVGHSLGTLVNAAAANYIHREAWAGEPISPTLSWTNIPIHMTLFDEAEIATSAHLKDVARDFFQVLKGSGDFLSRPKRYNLHPLPKTFVWADNYISAFGLPHPEAVNVILTNTIPAQAIVFSDWWSAVYAFHGYPISWYDETIQTDASALGWKWSFEQLGFASAPATNTVYIQSLGSSPWNVVQTNWQNATNWLDSRILNYHHSLWAAISTTANNLITANGTVKADQLTTGPPSYLYNIIINFFTSVFGGPGAQSVSPHGFATSNASVSNVPAYAWITVFVPTNAVAMSFDFKLLGDGASDSFVAAINGTNVISLAANLIETNLLVNSGQIDVSAFAGQTAELFFGIVGGTSTNAQITVQDILFYTVSSNPVDSVGDGIPDSWRAQYFPNVDPAGTTTNNLSCATCDPDGDAMNNLQEYLAGTDPTNSASAFRIIGIAQESDDMRVTWTMSSGKTNALQATAGDISGGFTNTFTDLFTVTNTAGTVTNYLDVGAANAPSRFYRIRLVP